MYSYQATRKRTRYSPYRYRRYPYKRTYGRTYTRKYHARRPYKTYNTRKVAYARTTKRKVGPQPVRLGHTLKALRAAIKMNEDFVLMFTGSTTSTSAVENMTSVNSLQLCHAADVNDMFQMLPPVNSNGPSKSGNNALIIKGGEHLITFSNFASEIADVFVWIVRARRDCPVQGGNTQYLSPSNAWQQGVEGITFGNVTPAPSSQGGYLHPHSQPTDSAIFSTYWYICKKMRFQLLPGGTKDVKYNLGNMPVKAYASTEGDINYVGGTAGLTMSLLWQIRGAPCLNQLGGTQLYYSRPSVGVLENKRYHFTYTGDPTKNISYNTSTPGNNPLPAPAYINPLSGYFNVSGPNVTVINTNANPVPVIGTGTLSAGTFLNTKTVTS